MGRSNDVLVLEEGEVLAIASSKTAKGEFFRIEVEDKDTGDVEWYGLGSDAPDFGEGSIISFDYEESGKFLNIDAGSLEVIDLVEPKKRGGGRGNKSNSRGGSRGSSRGSNDDDSRSSRSSRSGRGSSSRSSDRSSDKGSSSRSSSRSSGSKGKPAGKGETNWAEKDLRSGLGFAREQAIKVLGAMIAEGAIKLPAKAGDKMDAYLEYLDMLTARFLEQGDNYVSDGISAIYEDAGDE